jgi:DNA-binding transcriptional ArsR family regulator
VDVYEAIAEPNRRTLLDLIAESDKSAGELVMALPSLSQPAVSRHLRVLREAGLVQVRRHAQQRIYTLRPEGWAELDRWISKYRGFWEVRLANLNQYLDRDTAKKSRRKKENR